MRENKIIKYWLWAYDNIHPWLFVLALALSFVHFGWLYHLSLPDWADAMARYSQKASRYLCYACIVLMLPKHPRHVALGIVALFLLRIGWGCSGMGNLFYCAMFAVAARGCRLKHVVWVFLVAFVLQFLIANVGYLSGVMGDLTKHRYGMAGHSWGTVNPNMWAAFVMIMLMASLQLLPTRKIALISCSCCLLAVLVFLTTLSMTVVLALLALPVIYWLFCRYPCLSRWSCVLPWAGLALSVALMFYYGPSLGQTTFDSRFSMGCLAFERYGVSLMGQDCGHLDVIHAIEEGGEAFCVDNMYLRLVLYYGVVPAAIALAFLSYAMHRIAVTGDALLLSIAACFMAIGLMETYPFFTNMNFTLLCAMAQMSKEK